MKVKHLTYLPWWFKLSTKLALSFLPLDYEKIRFFLTGRYGDMDQANYAISNFRKYFSLYQEYDPGPERGHLVELGPGASIASGIIAASLGFRESTLIDVSDQIIKDNGFYEKLIAELNSKEHFSGQRQIENGFQSFLQIKEHFRINYETGGLNALKKIKADSADFIFSNSVLEHVRADDFRQTCQQIYRIQKKGSSSAHHVDYKDHLGGGLNQYRFPSSFWEKSRITKAGIYTNRLPFHRMRELFEEAGFKVQVHQQSQWDSLPIKPAKLALEFKSYPQASLLTKGALFILRK